MCIEGFAVVIIDLMVLNENMPKATEGAVIHNPGFLIKDTVSPVNKIISVQ